MNDRNYESDYERRPESSYVYDERYQSLRDIFFSKCIPTLFIGMVLWMFSTLSFGGVLAPLRLDLPILIGSYIGYFIGWIAVLVLASKRENTAAMLVFFATSFISGIVQAPIILWASSMLGSTRAAGELFFIASLMGVLATAGALFAGRYFGKRISGQLMWTALIGILILSITESILMWIYGFNTIILWTSIIMFGLLFITILYDGAHLKEMVEHSWMMAVAVVFIDVMVMIIRIFIILVSLLSNR
jgi:hypothetical protein